MSTDHSNHPHSLLFTDGHRKRAERAAVLLGLRNWNAAIGFGIDLAENYADARAKGESETIYCTPKVATMIDENPEFIEALCEEGVVEWLTPLVLTKTHNNKPNANA